MANILNNQNNLHDNTCDNIFTLDDDNCCPICSDTMKENEKITLKCNHSFCYECLLESYRGTKCNFTSQKTHRICPYCRTPASYLPLKLGIVPIKGIHREFGLKKVKCITFVRCKGILKSGVNAGKQCSCKAKPNTEFCGKHAGSIYNIDSVGSIYNIDSHPINNT